MLVLLSLTSIVGPSIENMDLEQPKYFSVMVCNRKDNKVHLDEAKQDPVEKSQVIPKFKLSICKIRSIEIVKIGFRIRCSIQETEVGCI